MENKNFKPYSQYQAYTGKSAVQQQAKKSNIAPVIGSAIGVGMGMLACKKLPKSDSGFVEATRTLIMAIGGNIGGVVAGSIGANEKQKKKKWIQILYGILQFMQLFSL